MGDDKTVTRSVPFLLDRAADTDDGLTLEGYAAVFDSPTRINDWEGEFDEVLERGAFTKTLQERTPVIQFDHGRHPLVGSIPLGAIEALSEDDHGLHLKARLHDNWLIEPVRDAIRSQSVDGMSFRFAPVIDQWDNREDDVPLRTVREVKLFELGPVVFPAYTDTEVGVRAATLAADPTFRANLATALMGTPPDAAAKDGTADEPGAAPTPSAGSVHRGLTPAARARLLSLHLQGL